MLPRTVDPIKFAKQNAQMEGSIKLSTFRRLQEIGDQKDLEVQVTLVFGQDLSRIYFIRGQLIATVNLTCQRCNCAMTYLIDNSLALSPVTSEDRAKNLSDSYEPIFMHDDSVNLHEAIEEEILLALPMVPKHEACVAVKK